MAIETIDIIVQSIKKINPNAKYAIRGRDINNIEWLENTTPIPVVDIEAQLSQVELDIAMETLRAKRNKIIAETDYLSLSDNTLSTNMSTYRQSLRDITNGLTTIEQVNNITWPIKP